MPGAPSKSGTYNPDFDSKRSIFANLLAHVFSGGPQALYSITSPGIIAHFAITKTSLGLLFSIQGGIVAITALTVGLFAHRMNLRLACIISTLLHIVGNAAAFVIDDWHLFVLSRAIVAAADGVILSCTNAALARSNNHTRNWSLTIVATGAFAAAGSFFLSQLIETSGLLYFFGFLSLIGILALPTLWWLPKYTAQGEERKASKGSPFQALADPKGILLLAMVTCFTSGMYALTPFSVLIGQENGWSLSEVGGLKSLAFIAATMVPFIPIIMGNRMGLGWPLVVIASVMSVSAFLLGFFPFGIIYAVGLIGLEGIARLGSAYSHSVMARHNPAGNLNAALLAFIGLGGAIGPAVGGSLRDATGSFAASATFSIVMLLIGLGTLAWFGFHMDRAKRASERAAAEAGAVEAAPG